MAQKPVNNKSRGKKLAGSWEKGLWKQRRRGRGGVEENRRRKGSEYSRKRVMRKKKEETVRHRGEQKRQHGTVGG